MRTLDIAVLGAAAALLISCAGPQKRPDWAALDGRARVSADWEGVGLAAFKPGAADSVKQARDAAYNDALQKLALKLRAVVRGEVKTRLQAAVRKSGRSSSEVSSEEIESATRSATKAVLGKKQFDEYRDESKREYWVRCRMEQADIDAALKAAAARAEAQRDQRTVWVKLSSSDEHLAALAENQFKSVLDAKGFTVLGQDGASRARIVVSGEGRIEDLGSAQAMGVDMGKSCRTTMRVEAVVGRGTPGQKVVAGRLPKHALGIGRTPNEACENSIRKAAEEAAGILAAVIFNALED